MHRIAFSLWIFSLFYCSRLLQQQKIILVVAGCSIVLVSERDSVKFKESEKFQTCSPISVHFIGWLWAHPTWHHWVRQQPLKLLLRELSVIRETKERKLANLWPLSDKLLTPFLRSRRFALAEPLALPEVSLASMPKSKPWEPQKKNIWLEWSVLIRYWQPQEWVRQVVVNWIWALHLIQGSTGFWLALIHLLWLVSMVWRVLNYLMFFSF